MIDPVGADVRAGRNEPIPDANGIFFLKNRAKKA